MSAKVYTYSEFIQQLFGIKNYGSELKKIPDKKEARPLSAGALGITYLYKGKIVKMMKLCNDQSSFHCELAVNKNLIYSKTVTIKGEKINFTFVPDFIMELIIAKTFKNLGSLLLGASKFYRLGYDFSGYNPAIFIEMKKYVPISLQNLSETELAFKIFQCMISVFLLQKTLRFTHYDLHWGNILLSEPKEVKVQITSKIALKFPLMEWPVLIDFGTSIFSLGAPAGSNFLRYQFLNFTNNLMDPKIWQAYNKYFDGLTLLKSLQLEDIDIFGGNYSKIVSCFFKTRNPLSFYQSNRKLFYRPEVARINSDKDKLFTPREIIANLVNTFIQQAPFNQINYNYTGPVNFGLNSQAYPFPIAPLLPVLDPLEIPDAPVIQRKTYLLSSQLPPLNIRTIIPNVSTNIFAFSLFISKRYFIAAYRLMCDPSFNIAYSPNRGKTSDDAFYRHYLGKQLEECISLIKNNGIVSGSPGDGKDQWKDFGTLILVDKYVLEMPMFVPAGDLMVPWLKKGRRPVDRIEVARQCQLGTDPKIIMKNYGWGTIEDYIKFVAIKELSERQRARFSIYEYQLPDSMTEDVTVFKNIKSRNSSGFIGSIVRFATLQDPYFDVINFRDAHSSMPNRNFLYDRSWYDTWIGQTDKKIWMYHGAFYNPVHGSGMKIAFAATWGARRTRPGAILNIQEYEEIFGFAQIDPQQYFGKIDYGIDERLLYRVANDPDFQKETYLIGMTHLIYLVIGQTNPRDYRIFENLPAGTTPTPKQLANMPDPALIKIDGRPVICRDFEFIMPDYSFYTDMRCIFIAGLGQAANKYGVKVKDVTGQEYFSWLSEKLSGNDDIGCDTLWKMLPPRWNIWQYLFGHDYLDSVSLYDYVKNGSLALGLNFNTICKINRFLWVGNLFNFDKFFRGQVTDLPDVITLPDDYPEPNKKMVIE